MIRLSLARISVNSVSKVFEFGRCGTTIGPNSADAGQVRPISAEAGPELV